MTVVDNNTLNNLLSLVNTVVTLGLAVSSGWAQRHGRKEITGLLIVVCDEHVVLDVAGPDAEVIEFRRRDIETVVKAA